MTKLSQATLGSAVVEAEAARMVTEKAAATWESALALQFGLVSRNDAHRFGGGPAVLAAAAVERLAAKGVRPYAKRVRAQCPAARKR